MNYDLSNFHPECKNKSIQASFDGHLYIWCADCQILANVEAVAGKIVPSDACKPGKILRTCYGKQSPNVDRGGVKE